jgi:ADP-ribosylglycohydrolase
VKERKCLSGPGLTTTRPIIGRKVPVVDETRKDRIAGVLVGAAAGDALGVPYEFASPPPEGEAPRMLGGGLGNYAPGEYSDDTQMAVCIAEVSATGADLRDPGALDRIAVNFCRWRAEGATDIGIQTRRVIEGVQQFPDEGLGAEMRNAGRALHERSGRSAGNGSLMRTGIVALAYLDDPAAMADAARAVSELTHWDPLAAEACILWCEGIRHAVLHGTFDGVTNGLELLPADRRAQWAQWLDEAPRKEPWSFPNNGFVVTALQAAWSAINRTDGLREGLYAAVGAGNDTDTVAAIAGALLGARWGASAVPEEWRTIIHGWENKRADDLIDLALRTVTSRS